MTAPSVGLSRACGWRCRGVFTASQVRVTQVASARRRTIEVDAAIDSAWQRVNARPGVRLFDGPVGRLESFSPPDAADPVLRLSLSRTSYRVVVGTNFENPHLAHRFGPDVMANPLGVSTGVVSADGLLLLGRRTAAVAYYPSRVHPFAGSLQIRDDIDLFEDARRELREELNLSDADIDSITCHGLYEDARMMHCDAIFTARVALTRRQVEERLDPDEHDAIVTTKLSELGHHRLDPSWTPFSHAVLDALRLPAPPKPAPGCSALPTLGGMARLDRLLMMLQKSPVDPFLLYSVAMEYKNAGEASKAIDFFDRALAADPGYCYAYYQKGQTLERADRSDDAAAAYRAGIDAARRVGDPKALSELREALTIIE